MAAEMAGQPRLSARLGVQRAVYGPIAIPSRTTLTQSTAFTDVMASKSTPFPTLVFDPVEQWEWPSPPLDWPHEPPPIKGTPQPCAIEAPSGATVLGDMLDFDPQAARVVFRAKAGSPPGSLAFSRFRRLTLVEPLRAAPQFAGAPLERVPAARQERDYALQSSGTAKVPTLSGRTAGHVETSAGLFLFAPVDEEAALQRVFVPRWAYSHCSFGLSAEEIAAKLWISTPQALLEAIERQDRAPVLPIGQSILALGLMTQAQLDRALAKPSAGVPLGEALVAARVITKSDLQAAIAHKMGYPMVDLTRFPIDPEVVSKVPKDVAARHHMLPLMMDKERLIVAVDRPSRVVDLRSLHLSVRTPVVPVLAPRLQIAAALDRLSRDLWSQHVADSATQFLPTN
jgi:hypothetical protein